MEAPEKRGGKIKEFVPGGIRKQRTQTIYFQKWAGHIYGYKEQH